MAQILDITQGLEYLHEAKPSIVRRGPKSVSITALISNSSQPNTWSISSSRTSAVLAWQALD